MFVNLLNEKQQAILLQKAKELASADGVLHDNEEKIIATIIAQMNPNAASIEPGDPKCEFIDHRSKIALMLELIGIAHADQNYESNEKNMIIAIANEIQLAPDIVDKIENWVVRP